MCHVLEVILMRRRWHVMFAKYYGLLSNCRPWRQKLSDGCHGESRKCQVNQIINMGAWFEMPQYGKRRYEL